MKVLVTGGAGYVGSHAVRLLMLAGHDVWVYDNLSRGHREAVPPGRLIVGDLADHSALVEALQSREIEAVMHFAAFMEVGESVRDPNRYYQNNLAGTLTLLQAMLTADVKRIVFSSTAAVYGQPEQSPIPEDAPIRPINPYGFTKAAIEQALSDYAAAYGIGYAALRYFNACGASPDGDLGEDHVPESHLIPLVLKTALGQREEMQIFGDDFDTPDGTCVRDYVHVDDLGSAHVNALDRIQPGQGIVANLGIGRGFSVQEVIETCREVTGSKIPCRVVARRAGDPASLIADSTKAQQLLDWEPQYIDLADIIKTAWRWHKSHPDGYEAV